MNQKTNAYLDLEVASIVDLQCMKQFTWYAVASTTLTTYT